MDVLVYLMGIGLTVGLVWFVAFLWALRRGQLDDVEMAAHRIMAADDPHFQGREDGDNNG